MSKSLQVTRFGGPEVLQIREKSNEPLQSTAVRIQVRSAGVNFADVMMRMGMYPEAPKPPFTPGYEIAGEVTEVGAQVRSLRPGDRVLAGCKFGGYTTEIVLPEYQVKKFPSYLSDAEAAAIPVNFLTAWLALHELARIRKGDRVLIPSAAGGVGIAAVQMAAQVGAKVTGVVGSSTKFEAVRSLGAHEVILNSEWENAKDEELGGFQLILDPVGGSHLKKSFRRLASGGRVVSYGVSSMISRQTRSLPQVLSVLFNTPIFTPFRLMMENKGVFGLNVLQLFKEPSRGENPWLSQILDQLLDRFEDQSFKVIIGKTFPLEKGGEAQSYLQSRSNIGKVVLMSEGTLSYSSLDRGP